MKKIPLNVGIIIDGNRRYGQQHQLNLFQSYLAGYNKVKEFCQWSFARRIKHLVIYAFSFENWRRPQNEITILMRLFERAIQENVALVKQHGYQLKFIGRRDKFSSQLKKLMSTAEQATAHYKQGSLNVCISYGGRQEIVDAFKSILVSSTKDLTPDQVDEALIAQHLYNPALPDLDLLIRSGGQIRVSNFMLWQVAYTELFFTSTLWPAFTEGEFDKILNAFARRQRNFGV